MNIKEFDDRIEHVNFKIEISNAVLMPYSE